MKQANKKENTEHKARSSLDFEMKLYRKCTYLLKIP